MQVQLISQASVVIHCSDCKIWTDPWLVGKAFNNSWSLHPKPEFDMQSLDDIDFLWISHEHPDHFNIPTLKMLPKEWKERVIVLFQEKGSERMVKAFQRFDTGQFLKFGTKLTFEGLKIFHYFSIIEKIV